MPRFVFRRKSGETNRPTDEVAAHATALGATVLSQTETMLLVEGSQEACDRLAAEAAGYVCAPEVRTAPPAAPRVTVKSGR